MVSTGTSKGTPLARRLIVRRCFRTRCARHGAGPSASKATEPRSTRSSVGRGCTGTRLTMISLRQSGPIRSQWSGKVAMRRPSIRCDAVISIALCSMDAVHNHLLITYCSAVLHDMEQGYVAGPSVGQPAQLYNLDAFAYESIIVGYFSLFRCKHNMKGCPTHPEFDSIYIGFSRDGYSWVKPPAGQPLPLRGVGLDAKHRGPFMSEAPEQKVGLDPVSRTQDFTPRNRSQKTAPVTDDFVLKSC
jgi:hypothetical protein